VGSAALSSPNQLPISLGVRAVLSFLIAVGLMSFVGGLFSDPETTWRAFHVNFIYWAALSQSGVVFAAALVIVGARWSGPLRHIAEGLSAWVPISFLLCIVGYFGREYVFEPWIHAAPPGKEGWLSVGRVYTLDLSILAVLSVLTWMFLKASVRPTLKGFSERATVAKGLFESWASNWRGDEEEAKASEKRLKVLAPIIALTYVFGYTFIGYDQVMSLDPTWFSTMYGWYFCWGGWLSAIAATALIATRLRNAPGWEGQITRNRMHDLGKLIFAFSIFWFYLFFGQYIVIWFGNLPEETQWFEPRLGSQFMQDTWYWASARLDEPYVKLSLTAWAFCWWVPFWVLLGQEPKKTPAILGTVALVVLVGFWLERNALIWPALSPDDGGAWFGGIQIGIAMGFLGAFSLVFLLYSRIFPTLPVPTKD